MPPKINLSNDITQKIIKLYKNNYSIREIGKIINVSRKIISRTLKAENISIRSNTANSRKYMHNESYFETIDTEHKAYWLGFIYADGFIETKRTNGNQKVGITLKQSDRHHLEKFKDDINASNPVLDYKGSGYNSNGMFSKILLTSQTTVNDLINHGVVENKTLLLQFPCTINEELIPHFIRGYFDGDGSIYETWKVDKYIYGISFVGTKDIIENINRILLKNNKLYYKNNSYCVLYSGKNDVTRIIHYLYDNATIYLDRKYKIAMECLKKYGESQGSK